MPEPTPVPAATDLPEFKFDFSNKREHDFYYHGGSPPSYEPPAGWDPDVAARNGAIQMMQQSQQSRRLHGHSVPSIRGRGHGHHTAPAPTVRAPEPQKVAGFNFKAEVDSMLKEQPGVISPH